MKQYKIGILGVILFLFISLPACEKKEDIIGAWETDIVALHHPAIDEPADGLLILHFAEDFTGKEDLIIDDQHNERSFTFTIIDDEIELQFESGIIFSFPFRLEDGLLILTQNQREIPYKRLEQQYSGRSEPSVQKRGDSDNIIAGSMFDDPLDLTEEEIYEQMLQQLPGDESLLIDAGLLPPENPAVIPKDTHSLAEKIASHLDRSEKITLFSEEFLHDNNEASDSGHIVVGFHTESSLLGCAIFDTQGNLLNVMLEGDMLARGRDIYAQLVFVGRERYYFFLSNNSDFSKILWTIDGQDQQHYFIETNPSITLIKLPPLPSDGSSRRIHYELFDRDGQIL